MTTRFQQERGSLITAAACSAAIMAILVAGLLTYVTNEYAMSTRTHRWTQALHLGEAAVEMGFAEFNYQYTQGGSGFQSARGWTTIGSGTYSKTVSNFADTSGNTLGQFQVIAAGVGGTSPYIYGIGTAIGQAYGGQSVTRAVKIVLANSSTFPMGIVSKSAIALSGNNYIDSYDSSDSAKSTGGAYDSSKKQANGNIATTIGTGTGISMSGNADVNGTIATGAGATMTMSGNAQMGPTFSGAATSVATGEANGWITHDFTASIPDASLPSGVTFTSYGSISGGKTVTSGDWRVTQFSLSGNNTATISGNVRLYVTSSVSISGNAKLVITSGSTLTVYVGGSSVSVSGNGVLNNAVKPAQNQWYGLTSCTSWSVSGNGNWIGTVYAPQASFAASGNGDISGAIIANSVALNGNGQIHFDEALKNVNGSSSYTIASWQSGRWVSGVFIPE